jgi:hypothetical protein
MKSLIAPLAGAALAVLVVAGAALAASPAPSSPAVAPSPAATSAPVTAPGRVGAPATGSVLTDILGLTSAEITALRQQGLTLAQIAERQKVDPQKLIDALVAQWSARIDARLAVGAITADQAKTLKDALAVQAKGMVNQATLGGMRGAAVGAGPNGAQRGAGPAGPGAAGNGGRGMMRGAGAAGSCPLATTAPSN